MSFKKLSAQLREAAGGAYLLKLNIEPNPHNKAGSALFAYFDGTPSKEDLEAAFRKKYPDATEEDKRDCDYEPKLYQLRGVKNPQRWFLCQNV